MAEAVGMAASLIALIEASYGVLSYIRDVNNASNECRKISEELSHLRGVLEMLKDTVQSVQDSGEWDATFKALRQPGNPIETLSSVLEDLDSKLTRLSTAKGLKKPAKSLLWPLNKQETKHVLDRLERQKSLLAMALDYNHIQLSLEIRKQANDTSQMVEQIQKDVTTLAQRQKDKSDLQTLAWLSRLNSDTLQADIFRQRHPGSGNWFIQSAEFQSWVQGGKKKKKKAMPTATAMATTLCCSGIPGAGKTVLCSTAIQYMLEHFKDHGDSVAVTWFYCNFKARDAQTTDAVLGSIAMQAARQNQVVLDFASGLYNQSHRPQNASAAATDSIRVLEKSIEVYSKVLVVVDALDEYSTQEGAWTDFIERLQSLSPRISIMITSRQIPSIVKFFETATQVEVLARETDILGFVQARLRAPVFRKHLKDDLILERIIELTLLYKSQGMFLLTKLHADYLQQKARYNKAELRKAINSLPEKLDETYKSALERIDAQDPDDAQLAKQVISCILYTIGQVSPRILQQCLSKQRGEDPSNPDAWIDIDVLCDICAGLVVFHRASHSVRVVHYTAHEFLHRCFRTFYPAGIVGVTYALLYQALDSGPLSFNLDSFSLFAHGHIIQYVSDCFPDDSDLGVHGVRALFHERCMEETLGLMFERNGAVERKSNDMNDLRIAAFFDISFEISRILSLKGDQTPSEDTKARSLCLAAFMGHDEIVTLLLDAGVDPSKSFDLREGHDTTPTPCNSVEWAFAGQHQSTIDLITGRCPGLGAKKMEIKWRHEYMVIKSIRYGKLGDFMSEQATSE